MTENEQKIKPGLYRVFWKEGGSSLASVGMKADGGMWLAPTNWIHPTENQSDWAMVARLYRLTGCRPSPATEGIGYLDISKRI